nr:Tad domain-containing protein [Nocardioides flavescens]
MLVAILASTVLMGLAAVGVDTARWYAEAERLQKTADAAALAGVTYMPNNLTGARAAAAAVAKRNGYDTTSAGIVMTVSSGDLPSELRVSLSAPVDNAFGGFIGLDRTTITRSATADFTAPAPMGSPCNTFGNEPPSQAAPAAQPAGSALPSSPFPNCSSTPFFWAAVEGADTDKVQGDRFMTSACAGASTYQCAGGKNSEFRADGYYWAVHVEEEAKNTAITVQIYDPAYMRTEINCSASPVGAYNKMNSYVTTDGKSRYSTSATYCSGDYNPGGKSGSPPVTTFVLRAANEARNPRVATPISGCTKQFVGSSSPPTTSELSQWTNMDRATGNNSSYDLQKAQLFHQWVSLCTFTPGRAGDYYLQVRTNVTTTGGTPVGNRNPAGVVKSSLVYEGNPNALLSEGNTLSGVGLNSFALRAVPSDPSKASYVAVAGNENMPILQNKAGSTATFNLIRALPNTRGQYIAFDFFDPADGATTSGATVRVVAPTDAKNTLKSASAIPNCTHALNGEALTPAANCTVTVRSSTHNGQVERLFIPIPNDYDCNDTTLGGCWFSVAITFPSSVTDFTTWSANITGDPVRLIE